MIGANAAYWRTAVQVFVMLALAAALAAPVARAVDAAPGPDPRTVLVLGDSLSAGYGMAASQAWPSLLEARLRERDPGFRVVNASISGETTAGGLARIDDALARHRPAIVVIELGSNDALRGLPLDLARENLSEMARRARDAGAAVLVVGMEMPPNFGPAFTAAFRAMFAEVAAEHDAELLPFLLEPIARDRANFLDDNLHPTPETQAAIRDHVLTVLGPMIEALPDGATTRR
jgi:acyl-CoA thioesterase-1